MSREIVLLNIPIRDYDISMLKLTKYQTCTAQQED